MTPTPAQLFHEAMGCAAVAWGNLQRSPTAELRDRSTDTWMAACEIALNLQRDYFAITAAVTRKGSHDGATR